VHVPSTFQTLSVSIRYFHPSNKRVSSFTSIMVGHVEAKPPSFLRVSLSNEQFTFVQGMSDSFFSSNEDFKTLALN
jgi:hypothetical protein